METAGGGRRGFGVFVGPGEVIRDVDAGGAEGEDGEEDEDEASL